MKSIKIVGTGVCLPEKVLSNADLEQMVDTSDEWITQRTGIKERRIAGEGETSVSLSVGACRQALICCMRAQISASLV